jgi:hypothetical protein
MPGADPITAKLHHNTSPSLLPTLRHMDINYGNCRHTVVLLMTMFKCRMLLKPQLKKQEYVPDRRKTDVTKGRVMTSLNCIL